MPGRNGGKPRPGDGDLRQLIERSWWGRGDSGGSNISDPEGPAGLHFSIIGRTESCAANDMNCRKLRLGLLANLMLAVWLVCLLAGAGVQAQLNFSTGWGKRSQQAMQRPSGDGGGDQRGIDAAYIARYIRRMNEAKAHRRPHFRIVPALSEDGKAI